MKFKYWKHEVGDILITKKFAWLPVEVIEDGLFRVKIFLDDYYLIQQCKKYRGYKEEWVTCGKIQSAFLTDGILKRILKEIVNERPHGIYKVFTNPETGKRLMRIAECSGSKEWKKRLALLTKETPKSLRKTLEDPEYLIEHALSIYEEKR